MSTCTAESPFYFIVTLRPSLVLSVVLLYRQALGLTFIQEKKATAGSDWFNLPRTDLTPELKRDLQLLKMRNVLDPHRHYKKDNSRSIVPEHSQVGIIEEGPTEFFSARLPNKQRKRNIVEEILAREEETGRFKNKYDEIQTSKRSGKKGYYKALQAQRKKKMRR